MIRWSNQRSMTAILLIVGAGLLQGCVYNPYTGTYVPYSAYGYPGYGAYYGYPAYGGYGYPANGGYYSAPQGGPYQGQGYQGQVYQGQGNQGQGNRAPTP